MNGLEKLRSTQESVAALEVELKEKAVVVEENGLLSGLNNFFGRLFNRGPSAEEFAAAAEAAAKAAAEAEAARIATEEACALARSP